MKTLLLVASCLCWATASYAQTTPTSPPATTAPGAASGTKNVGTDRADAPQAPGMTTPDGSRGSAASSTQPQHSPKQPRAKRAAPRQQAATPPSPQ